MDALRECADDVDADDDTTPIGGGGSIVAVGAAGATGAAGLPASPVLLLA